MCLLSDLEIIELINRGCVLGANFGNVQAASLDVRIKGVVRFDSDSGWTEPVEFKELKLEKGDTILLETVEEFHLPAYVSMLVVLKSTAGRNLLQSMMANFAECGFNGTMTLELKCERRAGLTLKAGQSIAQALFFKMSKQPRELYGSRDNHYQHQRGPTPPWKVY